MVEKHIEATEAIERRFSEYLAQEEMARDLASITVAYIARAVADASSAEPWPWWAWPRRATEQDSMSGQ